MRLRTALLLIAGALLSGCASLPDNVDRTVSTAFADPSATSLGRALGRITSARPERSGVVLLDTGRQAFVHRAAMIEAAERAIDAQYYIWEDDRSGRDLAARMLRAADRGVRVRVLLDDIGIGFKDTVLYALDTHPRIEIRLYNPLPPGNRTGLLALAGLLADVDRLAPRMHSKLLLVDGSAAIIGGRNIADQYFDLHVERNFRDRDVLLAGPLVPRSGEAFDAAWASWSSFPIASVSSARPDAEDVAAVLDTLRALNASSDSPIVAAPADAAQGRALIERSLTTATWASAELIYNPPLAKGETASFDEPGPIANRLVELVNGTQQQLLIESGYVISGQDALDIYSELRERGVRVRILTNSLSSNDVVALHAGYTRSRPALIERGVELHELRADAASCVELVGAPERCAPAGRLALHAKTAVFDDSVVYVGSFNFNPRSVYLNTEYAVFVHSKSLAARIRQDVDVNLRPENSWRVDIDADGMLRWDASQGAEDGVTYTEPRASLWRRIRSAVISLLPFEEYL